MVWTVIDPTANAGELYGDERSRDERSRDELYRERWQYWQYWWSWGRWQSWWVYRKRDHFDNDEA